MSDPPAGKDDERFVQLLANNQVRLRAYVFSLIRDWTHADDVLQEASSAMWRKRASYDPERDYFRWACGVALIEVLRHRRKAATDRLQFDESLISTLAVEYLERSDEADQRRAALPRCLKKLSEQDRWLITARYSTGQSVPKLAGALGRPASSVYSALTRIRESLYRCVERSVAESNRRPTR